MEKIKIKDCVVVRHPFCDNADGSVFAAGAFWCLHCERVHRAVDWKKNNFFCPYVHTVDGLVKCCDGSALDIYSFNRDFYDGEYLPMYPAPGEEGLYDEADQKKMDIEYQKYLDDGRHKRKSRRPA